jgi:hypothetical protein
VTNKTRTITYRTETATARGAGASRKRKTLSGEACWSPFAASLMASTGSWSA